MFFCCFFEIQICLRWNTPPPSGHYSELGCVPAGGGWDEVEDEEASQDRTESWQKLTECTRLRSLQPTSRRTHVLRHFHVILSSIRLSEKLCQRSFFGTHSWPVNLKLMTPAVRLPPVECKQKKRVKETQIKNQSDGRCYSVYPCSVKNTMVRLIIIIGNSCHILFNKIMETKLRLCKYL